jgi:succinate dehydrogenase/fumarate reductase cytochrome b subunit
VFNPKRSLAAILSTTAIASGVFLASVSSAQPCSLYKSESYEKQYEQANWLRSPWVAVLVLPGIALATALSVGDRFYKKG